jgi:hypothetical protein
MLSAVHWINWENATRGIERAAARETLESRDALQGETRTLTSTSARNICTISHASASAPHRSSPAPSALCAHVAVGVCGGWVSATHAPSVETDRQLNTGPRDAARCTPALSGVPTSDVGTNSSLKPSSAKSMAASTSSSCSCAALSASTPFRCRTRTHPGCPCQHLGAPIAERRQEGCSLLAPARL